MYKFDIPHYGPTLPLGTMSDDLNKLESTAVSENQKILSVIWTDD